MSFACLSVVTCLSVSMNFSRSCGRSMELQVILLISNMHELNAYFKLIIIV